MCSRSRQVGLRLQIRSLHRRVCKASVPRERFGSLQSTAVKPSVRYLEKLRLFCQRPSPMRHLSECLRLTQRSDLCGGIAKDVAKDGVGVAAELWRGARDAAKAGAPRQCRNDTGSVRVPKAALAQMFAGDEVRRAGECRRRDA